MLDFGFSEILLTSAIALVVLGPERLPKVARQVGNWMGRARAMARQLSEQLEREVSADELLKEQSKSGGAGNRIAPPATYVAPPHAPYEPPQGHGLPPHDNYEPPAVPAHEAPVTPTQATPGAAASNPPNE